MDFYFPTKTKHILSMISTQHLLGSALSAEKSLLRVGAGLPTLRRPSPELSEKSLPLSSRAAAFCTRTRRRIDGLCGDAVTIKGAETLP